MEKPTYTLTESDDGYWYEFDSISEQKIIKKAIGFYEYATDTVELVFGDISNGKLDVTAKSNNDDFQVVINTVVVTVYRFWELYPYKTVSFVGSTEARTRIYRAIISKLYDEINSDFEIYGLTFDNVLEKFKPNKDYFSFQISKKHEKKP